MEDIAIKYELGFLARSEEGAGEIKKIIDGFDPEAVYVRAPLRSRLAYVIKKADSGFFAAIQFAVLKGTLPAIREALRFNADMLRFDIFLAPAPETPRFRDRREKESEVDSAEQKTGEESRSVSADDSGRRESPHRHAELSNEALEKKLEEILQ